MSSANIKEIIHQQFLENLLEETIISKQPAGTRFVLILDEISTKFINSFFKVRELNKKSIILIEQMHLNRQPFHYKNTKIQAIYCVSTQESTMASLLHDFKTTNASAAPKYTHVHLIFLTELSSQQFQEIKQHRNLMYALQSCQHFPLSFMLFSSSSFLLDLPCALLELYSPYTTPNAVKLMIDVIAKRLVDFCASSNEYPFVRYPEQDPILQQIAMSFQQQMNAYLAKLASHFQYRKPRGTILLYNRLNDLITPFVHEFTYEAMVQDLLSVAPDHKQIEYELELDGKKISKWMVLDEDIDEFWRSYRYDHIANVCEQLTNQMNDLKNNSSLRTSVSFSESIGLKEMSAAIKELPEYREVLTKLSQHLYLTKQVMNIFTEQDLLLLSNIEESFEHNPTITEKTKKEMVELLGTMNIKDEHKVRLLLLYMLINSINGNTEVEKNTGFKSDQERKQLFTICHLSTEDQDALFNMKQLHDKNYCKVSHNEKEKMSTDTSKAVPIKKKLTSALFSRKRAASNITTPVKEESELKTRTSNLTKVLQHHCSNTLTKYPYVIHPPESIADETPKSSSSANTNVMSYRKGKKGTPNSSTSACHQEKLKERTIVFVVGGITFTELRGLSEVGLNGSNNIMIGKSDAHILAVQACSHRMLGSTSVVTASSTMECFRNLNKKNGVEAYTNFLLSGPSPFSTRPLAKKNPAQSSSTPPLETHLEETQPDDHAKKQSIFSFHTLKKH